NDTEAKEVLEEAFTTGELPTALVEKRGLKPPIRDQGELNRVIEGVMTSNPKSVHDYRAGKTHAMQDLVGQVMKQTRGQAKAEIVQKLLKAQLDEDPST